jgi:hypothetical protein
MANSIANPDTADSKVFRALLDDRGSRRRPVTRKVEFAVSSGKLGVGPNIGLEMVDVAEEGLGLRLSENVQIGRELTIEMILPGTQKPLRLVGEVRWTQAAGDGTFLVGVWLRWRLSSLAVQALTQ